MPSGFGKKIQRLPKPAQDSDRSQVITQSFRHIIINRWPRRTLARHHAWSISAQGWYPAAPAGLSRGVTGGGGARRSADGSAARSGISAAAAWDSALVAQEDDWAAGSAAVNTPVFFSLAMSLCQCVRVFTQNSDAKGLSFFSHYVRACVRHAARLHSI